MKTEKDILIEYLRKLSSRLKQPNHMDEFLIEKVIELLENVDN